MMNEFWTNHTPSTVIQTPTHELCGKAKWRESKVGQGRRWEWTKTYVACKQQVLIGNLMPLRQVGRVTFVYIILQQCECTVIYLHE